jgi:hypothetical protein
MQFTRLESARTAGAKAHRPTGIGFHFLLEGTEFALDNYQLAIVEANDYHAPRHRHNFEQIRILLDGEFGFDAGLTQTAGSVGYFCEGTYYTQDARGRSRTLLLQVAGPSGQSYMSEPQLNAGIEALRPRGEFRGGIYTWFDDAGKKHNSDGYEAIWTEVFGKPVRYPKPQYDTPVLLRPERFEYLPMKDTPGVSARHLGTFNERRLGLEMLRVDAGASVTFSDPDRTTLVYGIDGSWHVDGNDGSAGAAFEVLKGSKARLVAKTASELYVYALPAF